MSFIALAAACGPARDPHRGPSTPCSSGTVSVFGACVPRSVGQAYCGAGAVASASGCAAASPCERGQPRRLEDGACQPVSAARAVALAEGMFVPDGDVVDCEEGRELVIGSEGRLWCLPRLRGTEPDRAPGLEGLTLDLARWSTAVFGADGGAATPALCIALARTPGALAPKALRMDLWLGITLTVPANDPSQVDVRVRVESTVEPPRGLESAARSVVGVRGRALQHLTLGSVEERPLTSAAVLTTRVRCALALGAPVVRPGQAP